MFFNIQERANYLIKVPFSFLTSLKKCFYCNANPSFQSTGNEVRCQLLDLKRDEDTRFIAIPLNNLIHVFNLNAGNYYSNNPAYYTKSREWFCKKIDTQLSKTGFYQKQVVSSFLSLAGKISLLALNILSTMQGIVATPFALLLLGKNETLNRWAVEGMCSTDGFADVFWI